MLMILSWFLLAWNHMAGQTSECQRKIWWLFPFSFLEKVVFFFLWRVFKFSIWIECFKCFVLGRTVVLRPPVVSMMLKHSLSVSCSSQEQRWHWLERKWQSGKGHVAVIRCVCDLFFNRMDYHFCPSWPNTRSLGACLKISKFKSAATLDTITDTLERISRYSETCL